MKQIGIMISSMCVALALSGCISASDSQTPRFYMLQSTYEKQVGPIISNSTEVPAKTSGQNPTGLSKKINIDSEVIVGVGPLKIPGYLDRPQIVTQDKEKMLKFAQFDRWGESLDVSLARLISEDLTGMLPGEKIILYPWDLSVPVKYQVLVEIIQLDSELDKDMFMAAQWTIIDTQNTKAIMIKRSEFRQPIIPHDYSGLAKTLSAACTSLSDEIAQALVALEASKTKEAVSVLKK
jgi:uncharacterized protein